MTRSRASWRHQHVAHQLTRSPAQYVGTPWFCRRLKLLGFEQGLVGPFANVGRGFVLRGWDGAEVAVQSVGVVPVRPAQVGELDVLGGFPAPCVRTCSSR
jgi:hypothetical protein